MKILLLFAIANKWIILSGDVSTAFLHAELPQDKPIFVKPPKEYYTGNDVVWQLLRPLYGLETAPKHWQDYFSTILEGLGGRRLKGEPNVYMFEDKNGGYDYVLVYVDDVRILGISPYAVYELIAAKVLLKFVAELKHGGEIRFLGIILRHIGDSISTV